MLVNECYTVMLNVYSLIQMSFGKYFVSLLFCAGSKPSNMLGFASASIPLMVLSMVH